MVDSEAVERTIASIEQSGHLGRGDRRLGLLRYLATEELAGRGEKINAYTIAMDVFGRAEEFDPKTDSIVRTEIGRLRSGLRLFNAESTESDLVEIVIPKGSYRPEFHVRDEAGPVSPAEKQPLPTRSLFMPMLGVLAAAVAFLAFAFWPSAPAPDDAAAEVPFTIVRIAVMPFSASGDNPSVEPLAFGLYSELTMDLSVYPWLAVVSPLDGSEPEGVAPDGDARADYVLRGDILWQGEELLSNIQLLELPGQELIWSKSLQVDAQIDAIEDAQEQVALQVVERLASSHGIAPALVKERNARKSQASLDAFLCFMGIYEYIEFREDDLHLSSRECLETVISRFPEYGEAHAALALLFMDEARQGRNIRPGSDPWKDATEAIDHALVYAPLRQITLNIALIHSIENPNRDLEAFGDHSTRLLELFPRHPGTLANVALRSGIYAGEWEFALPLAQHAIDLQSRDPSWYFLLHSLHAVLREELSETGWALEKLKSGQSIPELIVRYIAAKKAGLPDVAAMARDELAAVGFSEQTEIEQYVIDRRFDPDLEAAMLSALR
jgi:TolB-like protein